MLNLRCKNPERSLSALGLGCSLIPEADVRQRSDLMKRQSSIVALVRASWILVDAGSFAKRIGQLRDAKATYDLAIQAHALARDKLNAEMANLRADTEKWVAERRAAAERECRKIIADAARSWRKPMQYVKKQ